MEEYTPSKEGIETIKKKCRDENIRGNKILSWVEGDQLCFYSVSDGSAFAQKHPLLNVFKPVPKVRDHKRYRKIQLEEVI